MSENQTRILKMLADGKISVEEASRLLSLIKNENFSSSEDTVGTKGSRPEPRYLYVRVEPKEGFCGKNTEEGRRSAAEYRKVNIRIPLGLIRAGIKLKGLIPARAADDINRAFKEKGINFDIRDLKDEYLEALVTALGEAEINVDSEQAEVRIYAD